MLTPSGILSWQSRRFLCRSVGLVVLTRRTFHQFVNEKIPHLFVQVPDPETGRLREPESLDKLLQTVDRKTHAVVLVASDPPVVKIIDKSEEFRRRKQEKLAQRQNATKERKVVKLSSGISHGDLQHKLDSAQKHLAKRHEVEFLITTKWKRDRAQDISPTTLEEQVDERLRDVGQLRKREQAGSTTMLQYSPVANS